MEELLAVDEKLKQSLTGSVLEDDVSFKKKLSKQQCYFAVTKLKPPSRDC